VHGDQQDFLAASPLVVLPVVDEISTPLILTS